MENNLINEIENNNLKNLYYNTGCLKVTDGNNYIEVYNEILQFVKQTVKESGCIEFFAAPGNLESKEIILWEVWENEEALQNHMNEKYTKELLSKNLIELKWNTSTVL